MADILFAPPDLFLGLDSGLSDYETALVDWSLLHDGVMTTDPLLYLNSNAGCDDHHAQTYPLESPRHQSRPPSEAARSPPGMTGGIQRSARSTAASSSRSPASLILTPASSQADYLGEPLASDAGRQEDSDHLVVSPIDNISPFTDDSVYARHFGGDDHPMNPNHPRHQLGRALASSYHEPGSTSAPRHSSSQHSQHSRASSVAPSDGAAFAHQASFAATAATSGAWIDQSQTAHYHTYFSDPSTSFALPDSTVPAHVYNQGVLTNADANHLFRVFPHNTPFTQDELQAWNQDDWNYYQTAQAGPHMPNLAFQQPRFSHPSSSSSRLDSPASSSLGTDSYRTHHRSEPAIVPSQALIHVHSPQPPQLLSQATPSAVVPSQTEVPDSKPAPTSSGRPIKPARAAARRGGAAGAAAASSSAKRGGRQVNSHLHDSNRKKVSMMRKTGACWRCVLQRDPCPDEGTPCQRCFNRAEKGTLTFFDCDRSKLPDLILDFLPPSLTFMHSKQAIEDTLKNEVIGWDKDNSVDVYFTCGYGPALKWRLYEFRPKTPQLLGQLQYVRNTTGKSMGKRKYSPPFGLTKIDTGDDQHFERYLDTLMAGTLLRDFAWTCFEEETQVDDFQARVLEWLCLLYLDSEQDFDLHVLLRKIIRMMLITYIMGHTLTISEDTLNGVLDSVKHSPRGTAAPFTSPRLANRQLKFYFSLIRNSLYVDVLNWLQQTLHSSGRKESTWLSSFCVILGISMVLEEIERTIFIQADAKVLNGEASPDSAQTEAVNACERVDKRHSLLVGLFQCKYRDRSWKSGSFGHGSPELKNAKYAEHLEALFGILAEKQLHLEERKDTRLHEDTQCALTTRLVARFLLPFIQATPGRS